MSDAIGALTARIRLESPVRAGDDLGGAAISWSNEGEVWATIEATGATQEAALDTESARTAFRIVINRRDGVRVGWRAIWNERVLRIVGVRDDGAPRIALACEEELL